MIMESYSCGVFVSPSLRRCGCSLSLVGVSCTNNIALSNGYNKCYFFLILYTIVSFGPANTQVKKPTWAWDGPVLGYDLMGGQEKIFLWPKM